EGVASGTLPAPTSHRNRYVLLSVDAVRTRRGVSAGLELSLPEHLACSGIECAKLMVLCGADEDQSARRGDGAAKVGGARRRNSTGRKLGVLAEWDPPSKVARAQVNRRHPAPWWFHAWIAFLIEQLRVPFEVEPEAGFGLGIDQSHHVYVFVRVDEEQTSL